MKVPKIHPVAGPAPPEHLREHGAALWRDITRQYGIGDAAGLALVTMACSAFDRLQEAQAAIDKHGRGGDGSPRDIEAQSRVRPRT
jgi:phage terminase small subunit